MNLFRSISPPKQMISVFTDSSFKVSLTLVIACVSCLVFSSITYAQDVSEKDMKSIGKALTFVQGMPTGVVTVDIIYDKRDPGSAQEAEQLLKILSDGVTSGKIVLRGHKSEASTGAKVAYLTKGSEDKAPSLLDKGVITVSNGQNCVESNSCVLGVTTSLDCPL